MSIPGSPQPAKLVISLLTGDKSLLPLVAKALAREFGRPDGVSAWLDFDFTRYYAAEMGEPLFRRMFSFARLIEQDQLPAIKHRTNRLEARYAVRGKRRINLDPGYLLLERWVLATGKNYAHRIYIGQGIYADLTLIYEKGAFRPLAWTYPDYASQPVLAFLQRTRKRFNEQLRMKN